ncbi:SRPBCC domain-containing protein [bacterium]|nr:SRPBCC domain-containing protein [bacterium]MBP9808017.1 SRPBCC domain-containing protein [bacterium]
MTAKNKTAKVRSNELRIIREYNVPVQLVWDAWTDPAQAALWWGPRGFTITTHSKDLKVGGHWHYTMHGPDGVDYPNKTVYFEVEDCAKLVYDHGANDDQPPLFRVTVLFSESNGKTKMDMRMALATPEAAEEISKFIKKAGGNGTWDRLGEYLHKVSTDQEIFVINRSFDAPIDTVFEMWINPEHLAKWLPPVGCDMQVIKSDVKVGGGNFYSMSAGADIVLYGRMQYVEIDRPHRLVYTQQFCDENENVSTHPMAPCWPATMLSTVSFAAEAEDQTRVTVVFECSGDTSPEELAAFIAERGGMTQGWTGSFDKLENYLASGDGG